jgi:hypothetical protein
MNDLMDHGFAEIEHFRGMFVEGLHFHKHHSFTSTFNIIVPLPLPFPLTKTKPSIRRTHRFL